MSRFVQRGRAVLFVLALLAVGVVACERPKSEVVQATATPAEQITGDVMVPTVPPATPTPEETEPTPPPPPTAEPEEATAAPPGQPEAEPTTVAVESPTPTPEPAMAEAEATPAPSGVTPAEESSPAAQQRVHVVQKGDWIYAIARRYGVSPQAIIRANNIQSPDLVFPGQVLVIPSDGGAPPAGRVEHVVKAGETLFSIARQYGTTVQEIKRLNGLETDVIYVGQVLVIP